jgi:HlyD family secretion protein
LRAGSRPGEIEQARANLASAEADAADARSQYERQAQLLERTLTSQQQVDSAKAGLDAAVARVRAAREARDLLIGGSRHEDILQAEAQLKVAEAQLRLLERQLDDATLVAPVNAVVRARLLEPGDMASPERPVLSLAIMNPKWVRAYVSEIDLGRVREGLEAYAEVDAFPDRRYPGRIGFISSVAEFTPKNVETEDLRTSLVYEVRVLVEDAADELRLGMPATVHIPPEETASPPPDAAPVSESTAGLAPPGD